MKFINARMDLFFDKDPEAPCGLILSRLKHNVDLENDNTKLLQHWEEIIKPLIVATINHRRNDAVRQIKEKYKSKCREGKETNGIENTNTFQFKKCFMPRKGTIPSSQTSRPIEVINRITYSK